MINMTKMFFVYQWFADKGRYGEYVLLQKLRTEQQAKDKIQRMSEWGLTAKYEEKVVKCQQELNLQI